MNDKIFRLTLNISGRVQGVFFRERTVAIAEELGLVGQVCNNLDGTVSVVAEGEREPLEKLLAFCKHGPEYATVERVSEAWQPIERVEFSNFEWK